MNQTEIMYGLCTYTHNGSIHVGLVMDGGVWEINQVLNSVEKENSEHLPEVRSITMMLEHWADFLPEVQKAAAAIAEKRTGKYLKIEDVFLLAPVPSPGKMINVGLNFYDHAKEMGMEIPDGFQPSFFWKGDKNCIIGSSQPIVLSSDYVDWEAELAVVIGKKAKDVPVEKAMDYVAGFTCHNDVTDRNLMMLPDGRLDFYSGKSRDTFGPLGPFIVPVHLIPDPNALKIRCLLNGGVVQDSGVDQMVWGPAQCVSYLSSCTTLNPGDVIALGTGAGTGWAKGVEPGPGALQRIIDNMKSGGGIFLRPGDRIAVSIPGIGTLENEVTE